MFAGSFVGYFNRDEFKDGGQGRSQKSENFEADDECVCVISVHY